MADTAARKCKSVGFVADRFFATAVSEAYKSIVEQPHILTTIRNGGFEQSFRNRLLEVTEDNEFAIGFAEASEGEKGSKNTTAASRIDLLYRCRRCGQCLLAAETKTNFSVQAEIKERWLDACLQLRPLDCKSTYIAYAVTDHWYKNALNRFIEIHNTSVPWYKEFTKGLKELPKDGLFSNVTPTTARTRNFATHGVRVRVRVWLARSTFEKNGSVSLQFLNEKGTRNARRSRPNNSARERR